MAVVCVVHSSIEGDLNINNAVGVRNTHLLFNYNKGLCYVVNVVLQLPVDMNHVFASFKAKCL